MLPVTQADLTRIRAIILKNNQENHRVVQDAYNNKPMYKTFAQSYSSSGSSFFGLPNAVAQPNGGI